MIIPKSQTKENFLGTTNIYAMSDTHQDTRKTSALLSQIIEEAPENTLVLNCGDMFKGIYPQDLERDVYLKMKEAQPNTKMVMTLGNNDFGFFKEHLDYLANTVRMFAANGIDTVCANIFDKSGKRPDWIKPYSIVEIDGDKTLVTGMCIDNINTAKFGIIPKKPSEVVDEISQAIKRENPDNVVLLNHDYKPASQKLVKEFAKKGVTIDLVIGGHDHEVVQPDTQLNIYHPQAFAESMYNIKLTNESGIKKVSEVKEIKNSNTPISEIFEDELTTYEDSAHLYKNIAKSTLNLPKKYSEPCALGSFLADEMIKVADADIGFFSTGFLMKPLLYKPNSYITNYIFQKTICAKNPIKTVNITAEQLKKVFTNAFNSYGYGMSNPKFLQCSNNITIIGKDIPEESRFEVKQILINDKPILDSNGNPLSDKTFKCVIDEFIANGGQNNTVLQELEKTNVESDGEIVRIDQVLINALKQAEMEYPQGSEYPSFEIITL